MTQHGLSEYYAPLMSDQRLPLHIDPVRLAKTGAHLHGHMALTSMARLAPALQSAAGEAEIDMVFSVDREGRAALSLHLTATVTLICQRCLEPMAYPIDTLRQLGVVGSETGAERLPEQYEPLLFAGEPMFLRDLIEDELILSLPLVPRHSDQRCAPTASESEEGTGDTDRSRANPFAILAELKNQ